MNKEQLQVLGRTSAGKWVKSASVSASGLKCTAELSEILQRQIAGKVHHDLNDFDDHLDDLKRCESASRQNHSPNVRAVHSKLWNSRILACVQGLAKLGIRAALTWCKFLAVCVIHNLV